MSVHHAGRAHEPAAALVDVFASDVQYYLTLEPRQLPSKYLYDALGSALFDAICRLPWYPLTRAEAALLLTRGHQLFEMLRPVTTLLELGAGNGEKLSTLLQTASPEVRPREVHLVDISPAALDQASSMVAALGDMRVVTHEATYEAGLTEFAGVRRTGRALVLFLGSNIGNFDPPGSDEFLRLVRAAMRAGDGLLLGTDLVRPEEELLLAYDDPLGVTAAFNRNLLVRINRELEGTFDLDAFSHRAAWNATDSRVEMHLVSRRDQRIAVPRAGLDFEMSAGEHIWTESSYKFRPEQVNALLRATGFHTLSQWIAPEGFALTLARAE